MDPLSDALSLLKPRSYITGGFDAGGDWGLTLDDLRGRIKCYAVLKGMCWLSLGEGEAPLAVREGECFVLPTGRTVTITGNIAAHPQRASDVLDPNRNGEVVTHNGGGNVFLVGSRFEVNGPHAELLTRTLPPLIRVESSGAQSMLTWCIELMMAELRDGGPGSALIAQHLSHMMLVQALRLYLAQQPEGAVGWFAALADPRLVRAIAAMHEDPAFAWTLAALARQAGMSRSTFAERFRAKLGETPLGYLTRWRMMLAAERLTAGGSSIASVATAVGYAAEPAFSTAFKRIMGCSPRQYSRRSAG